MIGWMVVVNLFHLVLAIVVFVATSARAKRAVHLSLIGRLPLFNVEISVGTSVGDFVIEVVIENLGRETMLADVQGQYASVAGGKRSAFQIPIGVLAVGGVKTIELHLSDIARLVTRPVFLKIDDEGAVGMPELTASHRVGDVIFHVPI